MSNLYKDSHPISSTKNAPTVNTKIEASPHQKKKKKKIEASPKKRNCFLFYFILFLLKKKGKRKRKRKEVAIQRLHLTFTKKNKL